MNKAIFLEVTDICNHKCKHCSKDNLHNSEHKTASKELIDKVLSIPKTSLTISGGEPSMVKSTIDYIIEHETSYIKINTNLSGFSPSDMYRFNNMQDRLVLAVSMPSMNFDSFSKITGTDKTFHNIVTNLKYLNKTHNFIVIIVNEYNIFDIELTVNELAAMGYKDFIINPDVRLPLEDPMVQSSMKIISNCIRNHANLNIRMLTSMYGLPYNHKCDAGIYRLVIDINGDITPCVPLVSRMVLANINDYDDMGIMMEEVEEQLKVWMKYERKGGCQCNPTLIN